MRNLIKALVIAGVLGAGSLAAAPSASAYPYHRSGASVYFDFGNVAIGYRDGYYDRYHRWHRWERDRDRDYWRHRYHRRFYDYDRDRDYDRGYHRGY